ncbi:MAG: biotin--[acetyl-CoA-carboxylase] ligase [Dehalococcoidia bacterium]|nr:biotin--[acetyl-CoA-carboxylase] ligase [Dehalococcoidia bacterium]
MPEIDISPASLHRKLRTKFIGQNILYYPVTSSTMDMAKQVIRDGAEEGTIVIADRQTAGRGRLGRKWLSPPDSSILLSIILYPKLDELLRLNMAACLAVAQSIEKATGLEPTIKWPNDVLIKGKKVSGILIESDFQGGSVSYAIVGIALNVNLDPSSIPEISETATSLKEVLGQEVSRLEILRCLLGEFEELYRALRRGEPIDREWRRRLETLGKEVTVRCGEDVREGYAESVDEDGNLLLRCPDGSLVTIAAGDVTLKA